MAAQTTRLRHEHLLLIIGLLAALAEFLHYHNARPLQNAAWLLGDCGSYRDVTRALLQHGTVDYRVVNPRDAAWYTPGQGHEGRGPGNASLTTDGRLVPLRSVLLPVALIIPYALMRELGLLFFNVAQCLVLLLMVYWLLRRYHHATAALFGACAFLGTSVLRPFTFNVSPDVFGAVLMIGGLLLAWRDRPRLWFCGGLLMGLTIWLRPVNLVVLAALAPAALSAMRSRRPEGRLLWPLVGFALAASGQLLLNALWFGSPFITSYDRWLTMRGGKRAVISHRDYFGRPFWPALFPTLFSHKVSFLQTAPYWPLFFPAVSQIGRRAPAEAMALALLVFVPVLLLVKYQLWAATLFGNRFMLVPAVITALGLSWLSEQVLESSTAA